MTEPPASAVVNQPQPGLLLRRARVLDPGHQLDKVLDVRVTNGTIEQLGENLPPDGATVRDCANQIITPGLIDGHVHVFEDIGFTGIDPDTIGVGAAVPTVIDAGSAGGSTFPGLKRYVMDRAQTNVLAYLHVATHKLGLGSGMGEYTSVKAIDEGLIERMVEQFTDRIVGLKLRASAWDDTLGLPPLRRARRVADRLHLPLMVHIGQRIEEGEGEPASIVDVVKILRPGDIVTHLFTAHPGGLLDENGRVQPGVKDAYEAGLRFDVGHGLYNMSFDTAARVLDQGVVPHSISTDAHKLARNRIVFDLPTTMAKMLALGFTLPQLIDKATYQAAESIGRPELVPGIAVGQPACLSVLELREVDWQAEDSSGKKIVAKQRLVPIMSVRGTAVFEARPAGLD